MDKLTIDDFKKMLRNALVCITERSDEFSKLDAVLGAVSYTHLTLPTTPYV